MIMTIYSLDGDIIITNGNRADEDFRDRPGFLPKERGFM